MMMSVSVESLIGVYILELELMPRTRLAQSLIDPGP